MAKTDARWLNLNPSHFDDSVITALTLRFDPLGGIASGVDGLYINSGSITNDMLAGGIETSKLLDTFLSPDGTVPLTADWDLGGFSILGLVDSSDPNSAATKAYVDGVASGLAVKASVRVASDVELVSLYNAPSAPSQIGATLTNNSTLESLTIDGVAVSLGDRVLIKNQSTLAHNGIYTVTVVGDGSTAWVLTRATDHDESDATVGGQTDEVTPGNYTFVEEGTLYADTGWVISTDNPIVIGTNPMVWSQFSGAGQIVAGDGLDKTGNTLSVLGDTVSITYVPTNYTRNITGTGAVDVTDLAAHLKGIDDAIDALVVGGGAGTTATITSDLTVGSIAAGEDVVAGTTLQEFIVQLLNETFYPTFQNPSVSLATSGANTREVGSTDGITLSATYNDGAILGAGSPWNPSTIQGDRAGPANNYTFTGPSGFSQDNGTSPTYVVLAGAYTVLPGTNTFSVNTSYDIGVQPLDSTGAPYASPLPAGAVSANDSSIVGVYPWYWGMYDAEPTAGSIQFSDAEMNKVVASASGTINVPWGSGTKWLVVAVPATTATKTAWYVNALNNGAIGGVSDLFGPLDTASKNSEAGLWTGVSYEFYISTYASDPEGAVMQIS